MIIGVGIDMVKTEKMKTSIEKWGKNFIKRVFNDEELKNIVPGKIYYQRLAARFAAKEAVIKAISKKYPLNLTDILILNRANGAPFCRIKKKVGLNISLSITHIEDYAVACAVAEKKTR
ncbi:MAG: holo-ACP synthase [Candidatus Omnitrophota bacterium]